MVYYNIETLTICLVVNRNPRKLKPITIVCHDHCTSERNVTKPSSTLLHGNFVLEKTVIFH